jgi:Domain of unknown function (DUF4412)
MKRSLALNLSAWLIVATVFQAVARAGENPFAGAPTEYSVDMATTSKNGTSIIMKTFVAGSKRRIEQETNNGPLVVIIRGDVDMMYTVLVARKLYRINSIDPNTVKSLDPAELAKEMGVTSEKIGMETIDGEPCDKYHYSSGTGKDGRSADKSDLRRPTSGFVWISQSTHLPMKSQTATATTEWKNLNVGPQEPALFLPPPDFKRID